MTTTTTTKIPAGTECLIEDENRWMESLIIVLKGGQRLTRIMEDCSIERDKANGMGTERVVTAANYYKALANEINKLADDGAELTYRFSPKAGTVVLGVWEVDTTVPEDRNRRELVEITGQREATLHKS